MTPSQNRQHLTELERRYGSVAVYNAICSTMSDEQAGKLSIHLEKQKPLERTARPSMHKRLPIAEVAPSSPENIALAQRLIAATEPLGQLKPFIKVCVDGLREGLNQYPQRVAPLFLRGLESWLKENKVPV